MRIRSIVLLLVAFFSVVGGTLAYFGSEHGFTKRWRRLIMDEFQKRGINAELEKLTIDPFSGLVARKVRLFEDPEHRTLIATVNNITLDIDLARLVRDEQFLNTVDFRDADISVPVDPHDEAAGRLDIRNFSARIQLPEDKIEITSAEFELNGVHVSLTGSLLQPTRGAETPEERKARLRELEAFHSRLRGPDGILHRVISEIGKFHFDKEVKPRLEIAVFGDLDDPRNVEARVHFQATNSGRGTYYCDEIEASLRYDYPYVLLDQFDITDSYGQLHSHASYRVGGDRIEFGLESSIDSHNLLRSVFDLKAFGEIIFYSPPRLHVDGTYFLPSASRNGTDTPASGELPVQLVGGIDCGQFVSHGSVFQGFHVDFCFERDRKFVRNLVLDHKSGSLSGQFLADGNALRYKGSLDMDPTAFIPFFENERTKAFLRRFRFGESPGISIQFEGGGPLDDPPAWKTDGYGTLANFHYNGVPAQSAVGHFSIRDRDHIYTDFRIDRKEGHLNGDYIKVEYGTKIVTIRNLHGRVFPTPTAAYVAPKVAEVLQPYRFTDPPTLTLNGTVDHRGRQKTDLTVDFSAKEGHYVVLGKDLTLLNPSGTVRVLNRVVEPTVKASVFGGSATFGGSFNIAPDDHSFQARVAIDGTHFRDIATTYAFDSATEGSVSGYFAFEGSGEKGDPVRGNGEVTIVDGNVFSIPVLGPLSKFMGVLMPRAKPGYSTAREATAHFAMADNVIHTRDFSALTPAFKLSGSGSVHTISNAIDFDAEMNFRNTVASIVFFPVSKLLKYKGEGTLDDPRWRPVNFSLPRRDDEPEAPVLADGETPPGNGNSPENEDEEKEKGGFLRKLPLPKLPFPKLRDLIPGGE